MATKLTRAEATRIVTMPDAVWARREAALVAEEREAYSKYHGITPAYVYVAGSPQCAGHGTMIGGFVGQERWLEARDRLTAARRVRTGIDAAWSVTVRAGVATFAYRFSDVAVTSLARGLAIEVDTHGVDVSACPTPTAAIAAVRAAVGVA